MKKNRKNLKANNRPTTKQMKLLHWLTQLELSENSPDDSAAFGWVSKVDT